MSENKTELVKQLLVRFIRDREMKPGDKLPGQAFFREKFKVGTPTIAVAINTLKNDGVLEVRDKIGVYVIDPNADGHAGRVIGITARWVEGSPYYSTLLGALQMNLTRKGCHVNIFCYDGVAKDFRQTVFSLNGFPGLRRSIENGEIEGLIHLDDMDDEAVALLAKKNIPFVFVGSQGCAAVNGVLYDHESLLAKICVRLKEMNSQYPALCLPYVIKKHFEPIFKKLTNGKGVVYGAKGVNAIDETVNAILARPKENAHDVIVYFDDIAAQSILVKLALSIPLTQLPRAIICRNLQLMQSFAVPEPIFFNTDLIEVAEMASELLLTAMKTNNINIGCKYYTPKEGE